MSKNNGELLFGQFPVVLLRDGSLRQELGMLLCIFYILPN